MASVDDSKATAKTTLVLSGEARQALVNIHATHGVPVRRLVEQAFQAGLASVAARYRVGNDGSVSGQAGR